MYFLRIRAKVSTPFGWETAKNIIFNKDLTSVLQVLQIIDVHVKILSSWSVSNKNGELQSSVWAFWTRIASKIAKMVILKVFTFVLQT